MVHADVTVSITLLKSKTRVAPLKHTTIPKLELSGALLTAKLLHSVAEDLGIPREKLFSWTDSSIVLGWLPRPSNR